uniref:Uncharacterized protein n=1 Tax=Moniliophthora roreri TaxID=221103 RepID=A0A0W0F326_MONRR
MDHSLDQPQDSPPNPSSHFIYSDLPFVSEALNEKERSLDLVYNRLPKNKLPSYRTFSEQLIKLRQRAYLLRARGLELGVTRWSMCRKYLGVLPPIVTDIVIWNDDADDLERDILIIVEEVARDNYRAERNTLAAKEHNLEYGILHGEKAGGRLGEV